MKRVEYQKQVIDLGLRIFPLVGKKPPKGYAWKERASCHIVPTESYGIVCDHVAVIDADTREKAIEIFQTRPKTPFMVKTPRGGVHFFYRGSPDLPNGQYDDWDLRAGGKGYVVGVGSVVKGKVYALVQGGKITLNLPQFDPGWIPSKSNGKAPERSVRDPLRYISHIKAVSGQGGHKATFRAVCVLRDAGLSESEALAAMIEWNQSGAAEPPWNVRALLHKIKDAYAKEKGNGSGH